MKRVNFIRALLASIPIFFLLLPAGKSRQAGFAAAGPVHLDVAGQASDGQPRIYLPFLSQQRPPEILKDPPVWTHTGVPGAAEVGLFRHTFSTQRSYNEVELHIFADTRYEAWLDGSWLGRGPARFSRQTREYDIYHTGELSPGGHTLAILVHWAPNNRRGESVTAFLQAHLEGSSPDGSRVVLERTGPAWKALQSIAWNPNASLVHEWGLIGPTELLDLSQLPSGWMQPIFPDSSWPAAVVKNANLPSYTPLFVPAFDLPSGYESYRPEQVNYRSQGSRSLSIVYRQRSIPFLEDAAIPLQVIDSGLLSPGRQVGELVPPVVAPYDLPFTASQPVTLTLEVLSPNTGSISLDGSLLSWQDAGGQRPQVSIARLALPAGSASPHSLQFTNIPRNGLTFSVSSAHIQFADFPFGQGEHAGRRLLLAEPVSQPGIQFSSLAGETISLTAGILPAYVVLDLGRTVLGRVQFTASGPAGTVIDAGWDERLYPGSLRPLPYPGSFHPQWNQADSWVLDGEQRTLTTLDARAGRYVLLAIWGAGPVNLDNLRIYAEQYPLEQTGAFQSSDPQLNQVWEVSKATMLANMNDAYSDTPWRERGQWWADAAVIDQAQRVVFGETRLAQRGIRFMAEAFEAGRPEALAPNGEGANMLDFGMAWVQSLDEYVHYTGSTDLLNETYPVLREFLEYLESYQDPQTGLLDIPYGPWSQTVYIDTVGQKNRYGLSTAVNALYYDTLLRSASMADMQGYAGHAQEWRLKAQDVKQQANRLLYRTGEHRYIASLYQGEVVSPTVHAQAIALDYGLAPDSETQALAGSLLAMLSTDPTRTNIEVYGMHWVLEALGRAGRIEDAVQVIRTYFGHMLDLGATTWWEIFNAHNYYYTSLSHGWGSSPSWFLTTYLLGAQATGPDTWRLSPAFQAVESASGTLPLASGSLDAEWEVLGCGQLALELRASPGTRGEVILPDYAPSLVIQHNGTVIWQDGAATISGVAGGQQEISLPVSSGNHSFTLNYACSPQGEARPD